MGKNIGCIFVELLYFCENHQHSAGHRHTKLFQVFSLFRCSDTPSDAREQRPPHCPSRWPLHSLIIMRSIPKLMASCWPMLQYAAIYAFPVDLFITLCWCSPPGFTRTTDFRWPMRGPPPPPARRVSANPRPIYWWLIDLGQ